MKLVAALWQFFAPFRMRMILSVLLGFFAVGAGIGLMATSGYLIASAALHPATILLLWVPIVGVRFFGISRAVFRYLERYVSHDLTFRILARLRVWLYQHIEPAAPASLQRAHSGDVLSTLTSDVDTLQNIYLRVVAPPAVAVLALLLVYAIAARWNVDIAGVLAVFLVAAGVGVPLVTKRLSQRDSAGTVHSRARLYAGLTDAIHGMTELISLGRDKAALANLSELQAVLSEQQLRLSHVSGIGTGLTLFLQNFAAWVVLLLAIPLVTAHQLTGVSLTALVLTALASFEAMLPLATAFQSFGQSQEAAMRVFRLADTKPLVQEPEGSAVTPSQLPTSFDLTFRNVSFTYPRREPGIAREDSQRYAPNQGRAAEVELSQNRVLGQYQSPALSDLWFDLPHGKHIAVVGPSGSGKSTLVQLMVRFWEYDGSLQLGGKELRQYRSETMHNLIAVVPQEPYLFHTSIAENLRLAKPDASREDLANALDTVMLTKWVNQLPEGLNTLVGEQGTTLSGGERQRLALARAFLQSAPIWVLDEATNGLDAITEEQVRTSIFQATANQSLIWITHRLAGLEQVDEILVMNEGHIVERGSHTALLKRHGLYRRMWDTAASTF